MKYVIIVPDGAADYKEESLQNRTPMEAAHIPHCDRLVQGGFSGVVQHIEQGLPSGSDVGNMSILGYNFPEGYPGRAPFEAEALNIQLQPNEMIFRCNLISVDSNGQMISFSADNIRSPESHILIQDLQKEFPEITFFPGVGYRHLLKINLENLNLPLEKILTTPPHDIMGKPFSNSFPKGVLGQFLIRIMDKSYQILNDHKINQDRHQRGEMKANMIWLWGQGQKIQFPSFQSKYNLSGGIITAVDLLRGIAKITNLDCTPVEGATGYFDTNYDAKCQRAKEILQKDDFVFVHVESTDEAGHEGNIEEKVLALNRIDEKIIGPLWSFLQDNFDQYRIMVCPDHPTPVRTRTHSYEKVPFVIYGHNVTPNNGEKYSETDVDSKTSIELGYQLAQDFLSNVPINIQKYSI